MTAREHTLSQAVELFRLFEFNQFYAAQAALMGFTEYDLRHISMFTRIQHRSNGKGKYFSFKKDPNKIKRL